MARMRPVTPFKCDIADFGSSRLFNLPPLGSDYMPIIVLDECGCCAAVTCDVDLPLYGLAPPIKYSTAPIASRVEPYSGYTGESEEGVPKGIGPSASDCREGGSRIASGCFRPRVNAELTAYSLSPGSAGLSAIKRLKS